VPWKTALPRTLFVPSLFGRRDKPSACVALPWAWPAVSTSSNLVAFLRVRRHAVRRRVAPAAYISLRAAGGWKGRAGLLRCLPPFTLSHQRLCLLTCFVVASGAAALRKELATVPIASGYGRWRNASHVCRRQRRRVRVSALRDAGVPFHLPRRVPNCVCLPRKHGAARRRVAALLFSAPAENCLPLLTCFRRRGLRAAAAVFPPLQAGRRANVPGTAALVSRWRRGWRTSARRLFGTFRPPDETAGGAGGARRLLAYHAYATSPACQLPAAPCCVFFQPPAAHFLIWPGLFLPPQDVTLSRTPGGGGRRTPACFLPYALRFTRLPACLLW